MSGLLDVARVVRDGGRWTQGYEQDGLQCGMFSALTEICLPSSGNILAGDPDGTGGTYRVSPFGVVATLNERSTFCDPEEESKNLLAAIEIETEKAVGAVLWNGIGSSEAWLGNSSVTSVTAGSSTKESVAKALVAFHRDSVGLEPILHLGVGAALDLSSSGLIDDMGKLATLRHPVAVNPMYPIDGVAVTGPIVIHLDNPTLLDPLVNTATNRVGYEAIRLGDLDFDPCGAVVVGELPIRVYYTRIGSNEIRVYGGNFDSPATVDWGDGEADGTLAVEPGSSVDHEYDDPGTYTVTVTDGTRSKAVTVVAKE